MGVLVSHISNQIHYLLRLNGRIKQPICGGCSCLVFSGLLLSSSVPNNSWLLLQFANGISVDKAKKILIVNILPVSGDHSNGLLGITVDPLLLDRSLLPWLQWLESYSNTLFPNSNKWEWRIIAFSKLLYATSDMSSGALINTSSSSQRPLSFKLLSETRVSAQQQWVDSSSLWEMLEDLLPQAW